MPQTFEQFASLWERTGRPVFENLTADASLAASPNQWRAVALELADTSDGPMTDDGRVILGDGFDWREPPLALLYQPALEQGHDGAYQIGTITSIAREGNLVVMEGTYLDTEEALSAAELIGTPETAKGVSVSVDLAIKRASVEFTVPQGDTPLEEEPQPGETVTIPLIDKEAERFVVERCTAIGLTVVPQPAFDRPVAITNLSWDASVPAEATAEEKIDQVASAVGEAFVEVRTVPQPLDGLDRLAMFDGMVQMAREARTELQHRYEETVKAMRDEQGTIRSEHAFALQQMQELTMGVINALATALTAAASTPTHVTLPDITVHTPEVHPAHVEVHPGNITVELPDQGARRLVRDQETREIIGSEPVQEEAV